MKASSVAYFVIVGELCAATVAALVAGLLAQPVEGAVPPPDEREIVVEAPRTILPPPPPEELAPARDRFTGAPIVVTTVRISAFYGDLDLTQPASAARLMTRIERVSRDACATLDRLHPLTRDPDCVGRAVAGARPAAEALIAAAGKSPSVK